MKKIFLLSFIILIAGCTLNKLENTKVPEISPEYFVSKNITLSHLSDDIKYIPFDSEMPIKNISKIEITDSLIFLATYPNGILVFNINGKLFRQIGKKGKGPGEYISATKFALDNNNKRIYVKGRVKILVFDFSGNLIRELSRGQNLDFTELEYKDGNLFGLNPVFNMKENIFFNWIVIDTLGNELFTKLNPVTGFNTNGMSASGNISYKFDNNIHYWNHYNDTIYELSNNAYEAKFLFKRNKYRLTPETAEDDNTMLGKNNIFISRTIFESKQFLFVKYRQFNQTHLGIYDKLSKKFEKIDAVNNRYKGIINDMDGGMAFDPTGCLQWEGNEYLFTTVDAWELIAHVNSDEFVSFNTTEKKKELECLANNLNENDNPVLMIVKLKP